MAAPLSLMTGVVRPYSLAHSINVISVLKAIVVIAIQPNFAKPEIVPILLSFLGIAILIAFSATFAKHLLPIRFKWIAKMPELMLVAAIAWCFAIVFVGLSGVGLCWGGIAAELPGFPVRAETLVWLLFFGAVARNDPVIRCDAARCL